MFFSLIAASAVITRSMFVVIRLSADVDLKTGSSSEMNLVS